MTVKIFLDDVRSPDWEYVTDNGEWITVRTVTDCIAAIEKHNGNISFISFDHDLNCFIKEPHEFRDDGTVRLVPPHNEGVDETGYDVLTWLERAAFFGTMSVPAKMRAHSRNPVGRTRMEQVIHKIYERHDPPHNVHHEPIRTHTGNLV